MHSRHDHRGLRRLIAIASLLYCGTAGAGRAEQLPLKLYTTADGISRDGINRIIRASRGCLWLATHEGLSRFDGYQFINYTSDQGLPAGEINDILETHDGQLWFATHEGVVRFNPHGIAAPQAISDNSSSDYNTESNQQMFAIYRPGDDRSSRYVPALIEQPDGRIWCGTARGVFLLQLLNGAWKFEPVDLSTPQQSGDDTFVSAMVRDRQGNLWVGTGTALYRRTSDGQVNKYGTADGLPDKFINALHVDHAGRIWVGTRYRGLCELTDNIRSGRPIAAKTYSIREGLGSL